MQDAGQMGGRQSLGDPQRQRGGADGFLRSVVVDQLSQRLAGDELHFQKVVSALFADRMDGDDVGMVQRGGGATLFGKPLDVGRVTLGQLRRQDFQRAVAVQIDMPRQIDPTHRPGAQQGVALVAVDLLSDQFVDFGRPRSARERPGLRNTRIVWGDDPRLALVAGPRIELLAAFGTNPPFVGRHERKLAVRAKHRREQSGVQPESAVFAHGCVLQSGGMT